MLSSGLFIQEKVDEILCLLLVRKLALANVATVCSVSIFVVFSFVDLDDFPRLDPMVIFATDDFAIFLSFPRTKKSAWSKLYQFGS